jgi:hypothetical protein
MFGLRHHVVFRGDATHALLRIIGGGVMVVFSLIGLTIMDWRMALAAFADLPAPLRSSGRSIIRRADSGPAAPKGESIRPTGCGNILRE